MGAMNNEGYSYHVELPGCNFYPICFELFCFYVVFILFGVLSIKTVILRPFLNTGIEEENGMLFTLYVLTNQIMNN